MDAWVDDLYVPGTYLFLDDTYFELSRYSSAGVQDIWFSDQYMRIRDQKNSRGLEYESDYSSNANPRTLMDKNYIDTNDVVETVPVNSFIGDRIQPKNTTTTNGYQVHVNLDEPA
jgi:hypothetical protein